MKKEEIEKICYKKIWGYDGMADEGDLNSPAKCLACGFESHCPHHWSE